MTEVVSDKLVSITLPGTAWLRAFYQLMTSELELLQEQADGQVVLDADALQDRVYRCRVLWLLRRAILDGCPSTLDARTTEACEALDEVYARIGYDPKLDAGTLDSLHTCVLRATDVESLWAKLKETQRIWLSLPDCIRALLSGPRSVPVERKW